MRDCMEQALEPEKHSAQILRALMENSMGMRLNSANFKRLSKSL